MNMKQILGPKQFEIKVTQKYPHMRDTRKAIHRQHQIQTNRPVEN